MSKAIGFVVAAMVTLTLVACSDTKGVDYVAPVNISSGTEVIHSQDRSGLVATLGRGHSFADIKKKYAGYCGGFNKMTRSINAKPVDNNNGWKVVVDCL